jgi:hypothetical protein
MPKVKDLSVDDLEYLIEEKIVELLGDPDSGLELTDEFRKKLRERLEETSKRIPHEEVLRRLGQD